MKILERSAGALTNFEVLDLLRSRGAGKDPTRVIASVSTSEFKVFDYLEQTAACHQTRDIVQKVADECEKYDLAKAEILNVINIAPSTTAEVFSILEQIGPRAEENNDKLVESMDELVEKISQILPPPPTQMGSDEENLQNEETNEENL